MREAVRDKSYRRTPIGQEAGRFLRAIRWQGHSSATLDSYELTLARLALDHADLELVELCSPVGTDYLREFLDRHWGDAAPATKRVRTACLRSFFQWAVDEGRLPFSPAATIKVPPGRAAVRRAYPLTVIHQLVVAQPGLRDQIALQLLGLLGLRKNELRLLQIKDFDLAGGNVTVQGKGGKAALVPLVYGSLKDDLLMHVNVERREPHEFLLYPRDNRWRPMDSSSVHRWFKHCLERADLPGSMMLHELRHSAADELWRTTGDIVKAQRLLRHESVATTQGYLHPSQEDLAAGLRAVEAKWRQLRDQPSAGGSRPGRR
jgi:site-specific recombinase XerC